MVTPFHKGQVDEKAYQKLIRDQVRAGVDGIVPVGTTGESPALGFDEHIRVIELAVWAAKGRVKVLAGTGANATAEAIALTQAAESVGVDGSLQVAPYYNKPSQEGLFKHFKKIKSPPPTSNKKKRKDQKIRLQKSKVKGPGPRRGKQQKKQLH